MWYNLSRNGLTPPVEVFQYALGDRAAVGGLDISEDPKDSYLTDTVNAAGAMAVPIKKLDEILGDSYPDDVVLKIDVEGAEPLVLDGAARFLEKRPHIALIVEHNPETLVRAGYDRLAVINRLAGLGFKLWRIEEQAIGLSEIDPSTLPFCNLLGARSLPPFCR